MEYPNRCSLRDVQTHCFAHRWETEAQRQTGSWPRSHSTSISTEFITQLSISPVLFPTMTLGRALGTCTSGQCSSTCIELYFVPGGE